jgi:hypothetical protein
MAKLNINYDLSREEAIKEAEKKGLMAVTPLENELQIDIDNIEQLAEFEARMKYFQTWHDCDIKIQESQSGQPHYHIYVTLKDLKVDPIIRIFLQLFLGSDSIIEFLSYKRLEAGDVHPTLFLEK